MTIDDVEKIHLRVRLMSLKDVVTYLKWTPRGVRHLQAPVFLSGCLVIFHGTTDSTYNLVQLGISEADYGRDWAAYFKTRRFVTNLYIDRHTYRSDGYVLMLSQDLRETLKLVLWSRLLTPEMLRDHGPEMRKSLNVVV